MSAQLKIPQSLESQDVMNLIAQTLVEIRDELRRSRPAPEGITFDPKRVRRVKDMRHPNEPYQPSREELEHLMQTKLEPMIK